MFRVTPAIAALAATTMLAAISMSGDASARPGGGHGGHADTRVPFGAEPSAFMAPAFTVAGRAFTVAGRLDAMESLYVAAATASAAAIMAASGTAPAGIGGVAAGTPMASARAGFGARSDTSGSAAEPAGRPDAHASLLIAPESQCGRRAAPPTTQGKPNSTCPVVAATMPAKRQVLEDQAPSTALDALAR